MATTRNARIAATLEELNAAAAEYNEAKRLYDVARVRYELAREKFAKIKELAVPMIGGGDAWWQWESDHEDLKYVGTQLGDAIILVLRSYAMDVADAFDPKGELKYDPALFLEGITQRLEDGGYDFKSSTPQREVNAALINLGGVNKEGFGRYKIADSDGVLSFVQSLNKTFKKLPL